MSDLLFESGRFHVSAVHFQRIKVMKNSASKEPPQRQVGTAFVVERKGSALFINGNRILDPAGKPSVAHSRLRAAVHKVASKR